MSTLRVNKIDNLSSSGLANQVFYRNGSNIVSGSNNLTFDETNLRVNGVVVSGVPVGAVFHFAASTAPAGYLKANGNIVTNGVGTIQGVAADFSALYAILGSTYGAAGQLPDLRGEFIRGWTDGKVGIDTQTTFGRFQDWSIENILGSVQTETVHAGPTGAFGSTNSGDGGYNGPGPNPTNLNFDASRVVKTSTETRPRNIALLACIKY